MKKITTILLSILLFQLSESKAQSVTLKLMAHLPDVINESSGVEVNNAGSVWTHNDSGDKARIFNVDTLGNLIRTLYLSVDTAIDCEDITQDINGNYYLGDFGNNLNNRTDLRIYKIPNPDSISSDTVVPQIIYFNYPDQFLFPPDTDKRNFDCEAVFHFNDSLYLFSKNRGTSTYSRMYRLPDEPGTYTALLVDSFNTGNWITSADISPSGKTMVLLSDARIWIFTGYTHTDFFGGFSQQISMDFTQKEAIVFVNDTLVYMTDEKFMNTGGNLYSLNLASYINSVEENTLFHNDFKVYPNPAQNNITFSFNDNKKPFEIEINNILGDLIIKTTNTRQINISALPSGVYMVKAIQGFKQFTTKFIKE